MKFALRAALLATACLALADAGEGPRLPVLGGREAVASVNGEPITVEELVMQIGALHAGVSEPEAKVPRPDPSALLQRVINARLIVQEAKRIGLDQLPEVAGRVEAIRVDLLKNALVREKVKGITAGDPARVEQIYLDSVREMRLDSLIFGKEEDARAFVSPARTGADFDALAGGVIAAGKARGGEGARVMKTADLSPEIAAVVSTMKAGAVSDPIRVTEGFTVVKLFEVRYPESPEARQKAEQLALTARKESILIEYQKGLQTRYAQVNHSLLESLDFEAKTPGLASLRQDERVLAQIKGEGPIRVKDLAARVEEKFYHGVEEAAARKRVNTEIPQIFQRLLDERVALREARRLNLENSGEFKTRLKERTDGLLFDVFIKKVVNPEIKLADAELKKFYEEHRADYTSPEMMRLESLAFLRREDAQAALAKLGQGAELKWLRAHAEGQADPEKTENLLDFGSVLLITATLPDEIRNALAGAAAGDFRLAGERSGPFYVLAVQQAVPASPQPYEKVRSEVATRVFEVKRKAAMDEWAARLRGASEIKVFARDEDLKQILGLKSAGGA